jgi:hypothetical protein
MLTPQEYRAWVWLLVNVVVCALAMLALRG